MSVMQRLRRDERGATIVIAALSMVVLLGFAAIAIDVAHSYDQRSEDQAASDTGSVAALVVQAGKSFPVAVADGTDEVMRITHQNVLPAMPFAQWAAGFGTCTDPTKPPEYTVTAPGHDCISFTASLERARVVLPDVDVETTFGAVLGVSRIATTATAEAQVSLGGGSANILPFGLPGGSAGDSEICLKTGANPQNLAPCDGPATGNFGFLTITEFGNLVDFTPPSTRRCTGDVTDRIARNIARGVDHKLGKAAAETSPFYRDIDECNAGGALQAGPWTLQTKPGNTIADVLMDGFIFGIDGYTGRLTRSSNKTSVAGHLIDNTGVWTWLNGAGHNYCDNTAADGTADTHDEVVLCLDEYRLDLTGAGLIPGDIPRDGSGSPTPIWRDDIRFQARFAWVPWFHASTLGSGTTHLNIKEFAPVYIQTTLWKCNASQCSIIHDPVEGDTGAGGGGGNREIEAVTAINIPRESLSQVVLNSGPGTGGDVDYELIK